MRKITISIPEHLFEALKKNKQLTDVPVSTFLQRLIERELNGKS